MSRAFQSQPGGIGQPADGDEHQVGIQHGAVGQCHPLRPARLLHLGDGGGGMQADAARLRRLGCRPEAIKIVGSLKFDAAKIDERRVLDVPGLLNQLAVPPDAPLLVAGSTHPGEEALLAEQFLRPRPDRPPPTKGIQPDVPERPERNQPTRGAIINVKPYKGPVGEGEE